jgi:hypothetical protein
MHTKLSTTEVFALLQAIGARLQPSPRDSETVTEVLRRAAKGWRQRGHSPVH